MPPWTPKTNIYVDVDVSGNWIVIRTPYSAEFIEALKMHVHPRERKWVNETKAWYVLREAFSKVVGLFASHFKNPVVVGTPAFTAAQVEDMVDAAQGVEGEDFVKLGVRMDAPSCVIHAAFIALETLYATTPAHVIKELGVGPESEIRAAYRRICHRLGLTDCTPPKVLTRVLGQLRYGDRGAGDVE